MNRNHFILFTKMVGAGNDFVVIDAQRSLNYKKLAIKMCHRTEGIGADGLLVLEKSSSSDYKMRIFNPDGSEAEMCGNGIRCLSAYIVKNNKPQKKIFSIETLSGTILAEAKGEIACVRLSPPCDYTPDIPIKILNRQMVVHYIDTGVPHVVIFVDGLNNIDVKKIGPLIRFHRRFSPRGTNVNFVEQLKKDLVAIRTYERGVEDETRACGTGSVASAIISYLKSNPQLTNGKDAYMKVLTKSGEILCVNFHTNNNSISDVWLKGSAKFVAEGRYFL